MNILFTINKKFLPMTVALIRSIEDYNSYQNYYIFSNDVTEEDLDKYKKYFHPESTFQILKVDENKFKDAPVSKTYPLEIYYRLFAAHILPDTIDKVLYLDADTIVKGNLSTFYNIDLGDKLYAGASNVKEFLRVFNVIKNSAHKDAEYLNTGVLLMNLKKLREEQNLNDIYEFIRKHRFLMVLPDQDVLSGLYGHRVIKVSNLIYNISELAITKHNFDFKNAKNKIDIDWVEKNTIIIHYIGKNKPWRPNYKGILKPYYDKYAVEE